MFINKFIVEKVVIYKNLWKMFYIKFIIINYSIWIDLYNNFIIEMDFWNVID